MQKNNYNNLGIGIISIMSLLNLSKRLEMEKIFLVMPFITHTDLISYLGNNKSEVKGLEQLISHKINCFINFNKRYFDNIVLTINSLQYLLDMDYLGLENNFLILKKELQFDKEMGKRAERIFKASNNLKKIFD